MWLRLLAVALGGALGAVSRYLLSGWVSRVTRESDLPLLASFPFFGTLTVNIVGSFLLGLLVGIGIEERWMLSPNVRLLLGVGFLGALTTFSTYSFETVEALRAGSFRVALANVGLNVTLCLAVCWLGLRTGEQL